MVAVPLCGRRRVIGLLEAFSSWPFGFNDSDVRNLTLLAELVVSALKPEDEDRFAKSAEVAETKLEVSPPSAVVAAPVVTPVVATPTRPLTAPPVIASAITASPTIASPIIVPPVQAKVPVPVAEVKPAGPKTIEPEEPISAAKATVAPAPVQANPMPAPASPVAPAQKTASLPRLEPLASEPPEFETPVSTETATEPVLTFGQEPGKAPHKSRTLILLICLVIAAVLAAGVWWKWRTAQLGRLMVTETSASKSSGSAPATSSPKAGASANPAAEVASGTDEPAANEQLNAPASAQDLAKFPHITGIRHWSSADASTVVLDLEDQVQYEAHRLAGPDRIYFDLHDTQLPPELTGRSIEIGDALLNRIRVAQPVAGMTRVVLETRGASNFSVSLEPNPYRLVVEVRKIGSTPKGAVNLFPNANAENRLAIVVPPPTKEDLQLRARVPKMRIVVDAGHGGWDLGTVGRRGLLEKDLVLEIAERLGKLLETRLGTEVIYTRQDDSYIPLDERAEIANQAQADLFVSVHANYSDLPSARGVETYYTNTFSAPGSKEAGAKDVDARANAGGSTKAAAMPTLTAADLHERIEQSRRLAASVQRSLYGTLAVQNPGLRDRGIKEAGFVVLTESAMPGILAEVSFVSSPTDEQKLRSDGYREQIAEALYRGIARYAASSKGVKVASAAK